MRRFIQVTTYTEFSPKLKNIRVPIRIAFVSDLHGCCFGNHNERLLLKITNAKPDFVCITGDLLSGSNKKTIITAVNFLKQLSEQIPVFYVPGNHELKLQLFAPVDYKSYLASLASLKIKYLDNCSEYVTIKDARVKVTGISPELLMYKLKPEHYVPDEPVSVAMKQMTSSDSNVDFRLCLLHNPEFMPGILKECSPCQPDLIVSGHLHGGIIRLPILGGVISPRFRLFPKYDAGSFPLPNSNGTMIVSRGLGSHTIPIRIFNRPELVIAELRYQRTVKDNVDAQK